MKIQPKIKLEENDMGRLWDLLGMAYRLGDDPAEYQKLTQYMKTAAEDLIQEAFCLGVRYEEANKDLF